MKQQLEVIRKSALEAIAAAAASEELEALRVKYLGKKGELTAVLKQMGKLSAEERPVMGQVANEVRAALEAAIDSARERLAAAKLEQQLIDEAIDVTIPGKEVRIGHKHPMYKALDEIKEIFVGMALPFWTAPRWSWPAITLISSTPKRGTPPATGPTPSILMRTAA